jgi:hypothetical protein
MQKSKASGRLHPQANIWQQHSTSAQPARVVRPRDPFTIEEHLRVQREIEERARRLWFAKGCALKCALDDWLKAESEVLAEFARTLTQRQHMVPASSQTQTKAGGTSALLPATHCQSPSKLNPKSTTTFQHAL